MPRGINPSDSARNERRLWTPALLDTPPEQWFEASEYSSLSVDGSGNVSQWNDLSGKDFHATQGTSGARPTWKPVGMNGAPCVAQTSNGKSLLHSASAGTGASTGWMLVMLTFNSSTAVPCYLTAPPSTKWGMCLHAKQSSAGWAATYKDGSVELSASALVLNVPAILVAAYDGSSGYRYYTNGGPVEAKTIVPYGGWAGAIQQLFCGTDSGDCWLSGCGFTKADLNEADCQRLAGYLAWRYGVQAQLHPGNPYANKPPEIGQ